MAHDYLKRAGMAALLLGCAFGPARAYTLGWNSAVCMTSDAQQHSSGEKDIYVSNYDGSYLYALSPGGSPTDGELTSQQIELLLACRNGTAGYFVLISNTSTNAYIQVTVESGIAVGSPALHPAELSALVNADGSSPKNGAGELKFKAASGTFTDGWNVKLCGRSDWAFYNNLYYILAENTDGTNVYVARSSPLASPVQTQLVEACKNGQSGNNYWVYFDASTGLIPYILVPDY